jgi:nitrogenase iron protein NifH
MRIMAFYGKGGIGKSTVVNNLSLLFARAGKRVLQFGCDPKSDSAYSLVRQPIVTVMDEWLERGDAEIRLEHCLMKGLEGVDCIEVGGPQPGIGCGGRGITKALELVGDQDVLRQKYDVILFDILGDVVCGGFGAPLRVGYADEVYIVTSGELRALYAANNIAQAVRRFSGNGTRMGGLIANMRAVKKERELLETLASLIKSKVVHFIPKDPTVSEAEMHRIPVIDYAPECKASQALLELFDRILNLKREELHLPRPLQRSEFDRVFFKRMS